MSLPSVLRTYVDALSLALLSAVWASLGWETLRTLPTEGIAAIDGPVPAATLVMLAITVAGALHELRAVRRER